MDFSHLDTQKFSDKTLKGFLLKNLDPAPKTELAAQLNYYITRRVDDFWEDVVMPLKTSGGFDGNKINWYFEIYKEGYEAKKLALHPFCFNVLQREQVMGLVQFLETKDVMEYLELGTSFLSNAYTLLSSWIRDQMIALRLEHIYNSGNPLDWILRAEQEERGVMSQKAMDADIIYPILNTIGAIMSRRI